MIQARPGAAFDAFAEAFAPGLVGQISVSIYDQDDNIVLGPTTAGITEIAPIGDLARYGVTLTAPDTTDTYLVVWDDNTVPDPNSAAEELQVTTTPTNVATAVEWITGDDVALCCPDLLNGSDLDDANAAAAAANGVLYELSGEQFYGEGGPIKVRPGADCNHFRSYRGWHPGWFAQWGWGHRRLGCACLPVVTLAPYPVREIIAVKVNGDFLPAADYRLDKGNELVRMRDTATRRVVSWPGCQIANLPDTENGTWSVTYTFGADPPGLAVDAAKELACELLRSCDSDADCALPKGTTRVTRAGLTIEMSLLASALKGGSLGLTMVDLFLGTYNPDRLPRPSAVWSPDIPAFPRRTG